MQCRANCNMWPTVCFHESNGKGKSEDLPYWTHTALCYWLKSSCCVSEEYWWMLLRIRRTMFAHSMNGEHKQKRGQTSVQLLNHTPTIERMVAVPSNSFLVLTCSIKSQSCPAVMFHVTFSCLLLQCVYVRYTFAQLSSWFLHEAALSWSRATRRWCTFDCNTI